MNLEVVTGITASDQLEPKMHLKGKVIKTSKAGAIIDIGVEKPALLHVSQIVTEKNEPILRVEDSLSIDQEIDVFIRNIRKDRIEVTMRRPLNLEWREIDKDMVVKGKVVELENFGAFVDIGAERPGLIHISELTQGYVRNASEVVSIGDEVEVKIIDFNRRKKQIKLSMKALQPGLDEIDGVKITPAHPKRRKGKEGERKSKPAETSETTPGEPEPTAMELAIKEAMEKANQVKKQNGSKEKRLKDASVEQEDIISRTLNQRT